MPYGGANVIGVGVQANAGGTTAKASGSVGGLPKLGGGVAPPVYKMVLVLVALEVFLLAGGRIAFKHHHGG